MMNSGYSILPDYNSKNSIWLGESGGNVVAPLIPRVKLAVTPITHHLIYLKRYQNSHPSCYAFGYHLGCLAHAPCAPECSARINVIIPAGVGGISVRCKTRLQVPDSRV